jgi:acylphosphatase
VARVRRRAIVRGRVQGVWYRASAAREAARLGVAGSAANRPDGSVELVVEGEPGAVDALLAWARLGPPRASVHDVEVTDEAPVGLADFLTL